MFKRFKSVSPKVDFPKLEREMLEKWYASGVVQKYLHRNDRSKNKFSFLDGPITANNPMGVHHAWGRTYKDLWQRFFNMRGRKQRFQNGFDEQGLWVEVEVEKELGLKNKKDIENLIPGDTFKSLEKFINLCKERVKKYSQVQTEQSKRLGYFMDWDNSYHTSSDKNNYAIWNFLKVVHEKGWLYKGHDSVPWCPRCGTAISQHEILTEDYKKIAHDTVLFKLPVLNEDYSLLVWTTTPWTIPANVAVAVNPKFKYRIWKYKDEKLIIVSPDEIRKKGKGSNYDTEQFQWYEENIMAAGFEHKGGVSDIEGKDLVGKKYKGPFDFLPRVKKAKVLNPKTFHTIVAAEDIVVGNKGTGLLHIAPAAGEEDFKIAQKEKLPMVEVIDEEAVYIEGMEEFSGKNAKKSPEIIIDFLKVKDKGQFLHKTLKIAHRYPICWRCKTELVWRVVDEWYIAMDKKEQSGKSYRQQMVEVAKKINWIPKWGLDRELDWLKNMHDWLISKKRYWGLALPIWECQKCGYFQVIGSKEELKERAIDGWKKFNGHSPHRPWVDDVKIKCNKCGELVSRIPDVGNPWLDAGIVPFSTMSEEWFPADFITESFPGQFKNWFYSLIAMSTALKNTNPFKTVFGFASVRDEKGEEMHKSKGNAIEFNEAADKIGVDVMRWMYVTQDPEQNLNFGYSAADETRRRFHLMLWNIYNFFITYANIDKWQPNEKKRAINNSQYILDRWILSRLHNTIKTVTNSLEKHDAYTASTQIEKFVGDLSLWYVRRSRDRIGPTAHDDSDKNACYETLYNVLIILVKLLAPLTPFLADEIYINLKAGDSVHLAQWPSVQEELIDPKLEEETKQARQVVELVHAQRKEAGIRVRQPLSFLTTITPLAFSYGTVSVIAQEVNVKSVETKVGKSIIINLDKRITKTLKEEGEAREIVRMIQNERKKIGTKLDEKVDVVLASWPKEFEEHIKKQSLVRNITKGAFSVKQIP